MMNKWVAITSLLNWLIVRLAPRRKPWGFNLIVVVRTAKVAP